MKKLILLLSLLMLFSPPCRSMIDDEIIKENDQHPLILALNKYNLERFEELLEKEESVENIKNKEGSNLLDQFAIYSPYCEVSDEQLMKIIKELKKKGAKLNEQEKVRGNTPIHTAINHINIKVLSVFLNLCSNKDLNIKNETGQTPLHVALTRRNPKEIVSLLLWYLETDLNIQDNKGNTPLHYAANYEDPQEAEELIKMLLSDKRTNPSIKNNDGQTYLNVFEKATEKEDDLSDEEAFEKATKKEDDLSKKAFKRIYNTYKEKKLRKKND